MAKEKKDEKSFNLCLFGFINFFDILRSGVLAYQDGAAGGDSDPYG